MLSIVIINFRMGEKLLRCIESIINTQNMDDKEIIVVNKRSSDNVHSFLKAKFFNLKMIESRKFGVAYMRNLGINEARGDYLLFLDADTIVMQDLNPALEFLQKNSDGAGLGVKIIGPDGELQYSARTFYDFKTIILRRTPLHRCFPNSPTIRRHLMMDWAHDKPIQVDWVQGAFLLIKRKALEEVGIFDELSPFGFEDVAWCYRAHKKGWKIYYYPDITIMHEYQRSSASIFSIRALYHFWAFLRFCFEYGYFNK
ncbi:MAG: glycosyltransferase family 2 protein [bacterium]